MAYKLELPAASRLHPVWHVSCLKKVIGDKLPVQIILPELDEEGKIILEPEAVIETRTRQLRNRSISEYLIKWKNLSTEDSAWEDENFIQKHLELLRRWGLHFFKERGMLGPYNTSDYPITIVVVPLINIVVPPIVPILLLLCPIEPLYCYFCGFILLLLGRLGYIVTP